jgi:hypothetical protein
MSKTEHQRDLAVRPGREPRRLQWSAAATGAVLLTAAACLVAASQTGGSAAARPATSAATGAAGQGPKSVVVYKDPNCGCCEKWVQHLRANGFSVAVHDTSDTTSVKRQHNVPESAWSCHTALVDGFVIEGHVPASDIRRLLAQRPTGVVGLAVPGMPASAPGMDLTPFQPFEVLSFDQRGRTAVFAAHTKAQEGLTTPERHP